MDQPPLFERHCNGPCGGAGMLYRDISWIDHNTQEKRNGWTFRYACTCAGAPPVEGSLCWRPVTENNPPTPDNVRPKLSWRSDLRREAPTPKTDAFLKEVIAVCRKHEMSISHEDGEGAFIVGPFDKGNIEWLEAASAKGTE